MYHSLEINTSQMIDQLQNGIKLVVKYCFLCSGLDTEGILSSVDLN